jgi:hypothetical protein
VGTEISVLHTAWIAGQARVWTSVGEPKWRVTQTETAG